MNTNLKKYELYINKIALPYLKEELKKQGSAP